jgi:hypothetical protein
MILRVTPPLIPSAATTFFQRSVSLEIIAANSSGEPPRAPLPAATACSCTSASFNTWFVTALSLATSAFEMPAAPSVRTSWSRRNRPIRFLQWSERPEKANADAT